MSDVDNKSDEAHLTYKKELGSRLLSILDRFPSKSAAAQAAGISLEQFNKWLGEKDGQKIPNVPVSGLLSLAESSGVNFVWLATGEGDKLGAPRATASDVHESFPTVPLYEAEASAGHGSFVDYAPIKAQIPFTDDFLLRRLGRRSTEGLLCVYARGDSMEPLIRDGDILLVDTHKNQLTSAVFAVTSEYGFWVKRLNPGIESVEVVSDNPAYKPMDIRHNAMTNFEILGRVVWVGHTL